MNFAFRAHKYAITAAEDCSGLSRFASRRTMFRRSTPTLRSLAIGILPLVLAGCWLPFDEGPGRFRLGGSIAGLAADGLVLQNAGDSLVVERRSTGFTMPSAVSAGTAYDLRVLTQPSGQTCSMAAGSGIMPAADMFNAVVTCSTLAHHVGGSVTGLTQDGLVLDNGADTLSLAATDSSFMLPLPVAEGSSYNVVVRSQPTGQNCAVSGGQGQMGVADVQSVQVRCSALPHSLGGSVSGLSQPGLVLTNGSEVLSVSPGSSRFGFAVGLPYGQPYAVTVQSQPSGLQCSVSAGAGTMGPQDVDTVAVTCAPMSFMLGGQVVGLTLEGLVLANGVDTLAVPSHAARFTMPTPVAFGGGYALTVQAQPAGLTCSISAAAGAMGGADVTTPVVTCAPDSYTLGGTITGLVGTGLALTNGTDTLTPVANASRFTMPLAVAFGSGYAVTIATQPTGQTCSVAAGSGTMGAGAVEDIVITCSTLAYALGGTVSGLSTSGLVLANGADTLSVAALSTTFTMSAAVAYGATYALSVATQPRWLECSLANGSGTMGPTPVSAVAVSCGAAVYVTTVAGTGSTGFTNGAASSASFRRPTGVVRDAAGNLYVADMDNHSIRRITPAGQVTTLAGSGVAGFADGTGAAASFNSPRHLAVDAAGTLYVADSDNHRIRKVSPGGVVTTLAGTGSFGPTDGPGASARFFFPYGIAVDAAGTVFVADTGNHTIRKIATDGTVSTFAGLAGNGGYADGVGAAARFAVPYGLATDAGGNVYVADANNSRIRKISAAGVVSTLAGSGTPGDADGDGSSAQFNNPLEVAVDVDGDVYVVDAWNQKIRRVSPAGMVSTLAGTGVPGNTDGTSASARFAYPFGITLAGDGSLYVADTYNHRIRRIANAP